ncbi:MAG: hypothetical protein R2684_15725 [Pyrinomonadaceae bacterium]
MYGSLPVSQIVPLMADEDLSGIGVDDLPDYAGKRADGPQACQPGADGEAETEAAEGHGAESGLGVGYHVPARSAVHRVYWYLYMITDLYSRFVVGWRVFDKESGRNAAELFEDTLAKRGSRTRRKPGRSLRQRSADEVARDGRAAGRDGDPALVFKSPGEQRQPARGGAVQGGGTSRTIPRRSRKPSRMEEWSERPFHG